jgi:hypothetical protein
MPEISRFLGIVIKMFFNDHEPPHFHVEYQNYRAVFSIRDLRLIRGSLPPRVTTFVLEWAFRYRDDLMENWRLAQNMEPLQAIPPLE